MPGGSFLSVSLAYPTHRQEGCGAGRTQGHLSATYQVHMLYTTLAFLDFSLVRYSNL